MKKHLRVLLLAGMIGCGEVDPAEELVQERSALVTADASHFELAFHWAPVHLQSIANSGDFLRRFDFDADFVGNNNEDNMNFGSLEAAVYYGVTESTSHFFIYYAFFHPFDEDTQFLCDREHENDMEPMLVLVRKDGTTFGTMEAVFTSAHGHKFAYRNDNRITAGSQAQHALRLMNRPLARPGETHRRPWTYQEPRVHGLYHCGEPGEDVEFCTSTPPLTDCNALTETLIRYVPSRGFADSSSMPPSGQTIERRYRLIDLTPQSGLLYRRFNFETFADFDQPFPRSFRGDDGNKAGAPWADFLPSGETRPNPVRFVNQYLTFSGGLTAPVGTYIRNDFADGGNVCTPSANPFMSSVSSSECVTRVCAQDSFCCNNHWDQICVNEAKSICATTCSSCAHSPDVQGAALVPSCSQCVADVCNRDPFCCASSWDGLCVGKAKACGFRYEVRLQNRGWLDPCGDNQTCGSTGSGLSLEGMRIFNPTSGTICYQAFVQGLGWLSEVCDGSLGGTQGQNRRMEAVKITLPGAPHGHSVCYQATVPLLSQGEVCDGGVAGSTTLGRPMEALRVRIVTP
jgi:hypothetical protein